MLSASGSTARVLWFSMFTPTAAATATLPSLVDAEGLLPSDTSPLVAACWSLSPTSAAFWLSAPSFSRPVSLSSTLPSSFFWPVLLSVAPASSLVLPPAALAVASTVPSEAPDADSVTLPAPLMSRRLVARTVSLTTATATAAPTAAVPPVALPLAVVVSAAVCRAVRVMSPLEPLTTCVVIAAPAPKSAVALLLTTATAALGVIAMPPAEPAVAAVLIAWSPVASSAMLPAPVTLAPLAISARLRWATTLTATDAPMPTLPPAVGLVGSTATSLTDASLACNDSGAVPFALKATATPGCSSAWLCRSTALTPSAPATPTLFAPAPEATVVMNWFVAGEAPFGAMSACSCRLRTLWFWPRF